MALKICKYPGCGRKFEGKGNYCDNPDHFPDPNIIRKYHDTRGRMSQSGVLGYFADRFGMKRSQVKEFFGELSSLAAQEVKTSGEFILPGLGKLVISERRAREGRNPQTGESIQIPAKTTLKFRVSKSMKDAVVPKK